MIARRAAAAWLLSERMLRVRVIALLAVCDPSPAYAHADSSLTRSVIWLALLISVLAYAFGAHELWRRSRRAPLWRLAAAGTGWLALAAALAPPFEELARISFAAHMAQHEILMLVAAPLLVLGKPLAVCVWALPYAQRRAVSRPFQHPWWRTGWGWLVAAPTAWSLHALALWSWHAPAWFEAGLRHDAVHDLQHASFLFSAVLFWWALLRRRPDGVAVLYVLTTLLHTGFLGALLTFAPNVWYPMYTFAVNPWGLTPLADQQLGGLIMWVPAGAILMGVGLLLLAQWLHHLEHRTGFPATKERA